MFVAWSKKRRARATRSICAALPSGTCFDASSAVSRREKAMTGSQFPGDSQSGTGLERVTARKPVEGAVLPGLRKKKTFKILGTFD